MVLQNHLQEKVKIIPFTLGNTNGQQNMFKYGSSSINFLETAFNGQNISDCQVVKVTTSTLDLFIFEQLNTAPDLLKIDVEGAEALVIQGGLRTLDVYSPKILTEIHGPNNALRMWELLQSFEYFWNHLTANGQEEVSSEEELLSFFSKNSWTQHFLLNRLNKSNKL